MNKVFLIGRITKDLELRTTSTDKSVCEFNLAVNRNADNTDFITIQCWNKLAENLVKYQSKENLISVDGSLRVNTYEKEDGTKGYKTYVLANNIEYLSPAKSGNEEQKPVEDLFENTGSVKQEEIILTDDDLPF